MVKATRTRRSNTIRLLGCTAILAMLMVTGCQSAGHPQGDSLAQLKREQRTMLFRACYWAVTQEYPMNPYLNPLAVASTCSRYAKTKVP